MLAKAEGARRRRKYLPSSSAEIPDELIHAFATLPAGMASKRTIGLVMRGQLSAGDLATFGWTMSRIRQLRDREAVRERVDVRRTR